MERFEFGFARTTCACEVCINNCRNMPGFLLPDDLERIIPPFVDSFKWAESNLLASPGALVMNTGTGRQFRVGTLVPAVKATGDCIHLTADGRCGIHEIAPFGCAFFDCGPERDNLSHKGILAVQEAQRDPMSRYARIWGHLHHIGRVQQSPEVLRMKMRATSEVERLRADGWTQADFAQALKKELIRE
jgi:hypothetical protein